MTLGRKLFATILVIAGLLHFVFTPAYVKIMPPFLPRPKLLVEISGACEMLGGLGLLPHRTRRPAAWGLIALLIAVMPANVYMALEPARWPGLPAWALWARLPLQLPLMGWAWLYTRRDRE